MRFVCQHWYSLICVLCPCYVARIHVLWLHNGLSTLCFVKMDANFTTYRTKATYEHSSGRIFNVFRWHSLVMFPSCPSYALLTKAWLGQKKGLWTINRNNFFSILNDIITFMGSSTTYYAFEVPVSVIIVICLISIPRSKCEFRLISAVNHLSMILQLQHSPTSVRTSKLHKTQTIKPVDGVVDALVDDISYIAY